MNLKLKDMINRNRCDGNIIKRNSTILFYGFCIYTVALPPVYHVTVGPKGKSGFTEGTDLQPNTFQERKRCTVIIVNSH